jgi:hypothetical protein
MAAADQVGRIGGTSGVACSDKSFYDRLWDYARDNDSGAFNRALMDGVDRGMCVFFHRGDQVFVITEDAAGHRKIRRKGDAGEYWILSREVEIDQN